MIAADTATVAELNRRARRDRIAGGTVAEEGLDVAAGQTAGVGDEIITRQNDRTLSTGRGWVKNGDRWTVTATWEDGRMTVRRTTGGPEVMLPAGYVAEHVDLAYASTAHRIQGRTVDTAHALVSAATTREVLYVAATRGRHSNRLYVDTALRPRSPNRPRRRHQTANSPRCPRRHPGQRGRRDLRPRDHPQSPPRRRELDHAPRRVPNHRPGRPSRPLVQPPRQVRAHPRRDPPGSRQ